jgi:hypothetical protein
MRAKDPHREVRGKEGDPCGANVPTWCFGETFCGEQLRCTRKPDVGEKCGDTGDNHCLFPAQCVHGTCAMRSYDRCD